MRKSNYDKYPATAITGEIWIGTENIVSQLRKEIGQGNLLLVVDCYVGTFFEELYGCLKLLDPALCIDTRQLMKSKSEIRDMTYPYVTDDELFGYRTKLNISDFFDKEKVSAFQGQLLSEKGLKIVWGCGASWVCPESDLLLYCDVARWELQQRFRCHKVEALGIDVRDESPARQYKRGYFCDWPVCDALKKTLYEKAGYWLDMNIPGSPKMIDRATFMRGLSKTVQGPFRVVPFFDPAPWGGQWMKDVCDLDKTVDNFGWCFDCVPEENSLMLRVNGTAFEMPSVNLVYTKTSELLGEPVEARFGQDFPIRFDFLDTMGGGNLSLQVHPTTQYIRDKFNIPYTQDESYYLLDAESDASVFLGVKTEVDKEQMLSDLRNARSGGTIFNPEPYVNRFPAAKHDHFLIPGGTIHCSGAGAMVLEISSTPSIFTFKLWDWQRLGLDGKPRPINVEHGSRVINWGRDTEYALKYLVNHVEPVAIGDGWIEEKTGLHPNEFIETRRHWFEKKVTHHTNNSVNVLNLVEGEEVVIESPERRFEPFVLHYAETVIIPASVGVYTIAPYGISSGKRCGTIKAFIRLNA